MFTENRSQQMIAAGKNASLQTNRLCVNSVMSFVYAAQQIIDTNIQDKCTTPTHRSIMFSHFQLLRKTHHTKTDGPLQKTSGILPIFFKTELNDNDEFAL